MKILANGIDNSIVQISQAELANLLGYYSHYGNVDGYKAPKEGDEVQIHDMYRQLYMLKGMEKRMAEYAQFLRNAAESVDLQMDRVSVVLQGVTGLTLDNIIRQVCARTEEDAAQFELENILKMDAYLKDNKKEVH